MKTLKSILISSLILLIMSCNGNDDNSAKSKIEQPNMDLHTASFLGDLKVIEQHIAAGSDLDIKEPSVGSSALISAAVFGKTEVARTLIEGGADVNLQNNEGSTALHTAAFLCRTEIVEMLIKHGADLSIKNNVGSTAYQSVAAPFEYVKPIYDIFRNDLGPLGLKLDYDEIKTLRPKIAELLK